MIAHRLATVRRADKIAVVAHGAIVESGPHDDLMAFGGAYANLVEKQSLCGMPARREPALDTVSATESSGPEDNGADDAGDADEDDFDDFEFMDRLGRSHQEDNSHHHRYYRSISMHI